jgi:hypothetical protein
MYPALPPWSPVEIAVLSSYNDISNISFILVYSLIVYPAGPRHSDVPVEIRFRS